MTTLKVGTEVEWSCKIKNSNHLSYWEHRIDNSIEGPYEKHEHVTKIDSLVSIDTKHPSAGIKRACDQFRVLVKAMSKIAVNSSQGIHFHVSGFSKKSVIYSKEFHDYFISEYLKMCKTPLEKNRVSEKERIGDRRNY